MPQVPKGLAIVAFLKTRLDQGHDHLGLFEPLIVDALQRCGMQNFIALDICKCVNDRTGITIPSNTMQTLLGRFVRTGYLRREGGRWVTTGKPLPDSSLDEGRSRVEAQHLHLATELLKFAATEGVVLEGAEEALSALATFISDNKINLVLEEAVSDSPLDRSSLPRKLTRTIARFIAEKCLRSGQLKSALETLLEGIFLQDVLLMREISEVSRRFNDLWIPVDTAILFAALDLTGVANAIAAKEGLELLRQSGARTIAFSRTIHEMRRILAVYEQHLGTAEGRLSLHPTPLTQYILTSRLSSADIKILSATLEIRLGNIGVPVRDLPTHDPRFTLDEASLAKKLTSARSPNTEAPRIRHDVDVVAGVLTLRAGRVSTSVERAGAVFSTTSGLVIKAVYDWYTEQGQHGIPPIIHHLALTNIAWLKKPAAAPTVKMHELAAICVAAIRPTRKTWELVIANLRKLRDEGHITDDESAAIVASELMEPMLARLDDEIEPDADSVRDAIERVKEQYRREASLEAEKVVSNALSQAAQTTQAAQDAIRVATTNATIAQVAAGEAIADKNELIANLESRISGFASAISRVICGAGLIILSGSVVVSLPSVVESGGEIGKWAARAILIVSGGWYVYSTAKNRGLPDLHKSITTSVADVIRPLFIPKVSLIRPGDILQLSLSDSPPKQDNSESKSTSA